MRLHEKNYTARITVLRTKGDRYGNVYWGFRYVDLETDEVVEGTVSSGDEIKLAFGWRDEMRTRRDDVVWDERTVTERELFRLPHAGGTAEQLRAFVEKSLNKQVKESLTVADVINTLLS